MEYQESPEEWDVRVAAIMNLDPAQLPPLILEYRGAGLPLALHDGSHRHEALRRRGHASTWAFIWCNSEADFKIAQMTVPVPTGDAR